MSTSCTYGSQLKTWSCSYQQLNIRGFRSKFLLVAVVELTCCLTLAGAFNSMSVWGKKWLVLLSLFSYCMKTRHSVLRDLLAEISFGGAFGWWTVALLEVVAAKTRKYYKSYCLIILSCWPFLYILCLRHALET